MPRNYRHIKDYENEIKSLSEKYYNKITIKKGLEIGEYHLYKEDFDKYKKMIQVNNKAVKRLR